MLLCGSAVLPLLWMHPVLGDPASRILGGHAGDNVTNVWNCWWMRVALSTASAEFFYCPMIFVPWGTSLVLHTHTALPAFLSATLLGGLPLVVAQNMLIWAALSANAAAMFALAWHRTRDSYAATAAALTFAGSPFITAHLLGHWNMIHLWPLPLVALWCPRSLASTAWWWYAVLVGTVLAAAAYTDYYITVYGFVVVLALAADRMMSVRITVRPATWRPSVIGMAVLSVVFFMGAAGVVWSGGFDVNVGSIDVSAHTPTNALRLGWIFAVSAVLAGTRPRLTIRWRREHVVIASRAMIVICAVVLTAALPLIWNAVGLVGADGYAAPAYAWRSGPRGVDVLTVVLGHPYHVLAGEAVRGAYARLELDPIEQIGWMGILPVTLALYAVRSRRADALRWSLLGGAAFVWALGPFLRVAGADVGLPLPQVFQQFIPLLSNARIPGRAMALVGLALSMLVAIGTARLRESLLPRHAAVTGLLVSLVILLELWPAAYPTFHLRVPPVYARLSVLPSGALLEVPLGVRDGFGAYGRLDHEALFHQTVHGRPIFGGFVARLSPRLLTHYQTEPVLGSLLALSSGRSLSSEDIGRDKAVAPARLRAWHVSVVAVRTREASPELMQYVRDVLGVRLIDEDADRQLYVVARPGYQAPAPHDPVVTKHSRARD